MQDRKLRRLVVTNFPEADFWPRNNFRIACDPGTIAKITMGTTKCFGGFADSD
jgi:hypothetical protein